MKCRICSEYAIDRGLRLEPIEDQGSWTGGSRHRDRQYSSRRQSADAMKSAKPGSRLSATSICCLRERRVSLRSLRSVTRREGVPTGRLITYASTAGCSSSRFMSWVTALSRAHDAWLPQPGLLCYRSDKVPESLGLLEHLDHRRPFQRPRIQRIFRFFQLYNRKHFSPTSGVTGEQPKALVGGLFYWPFPATQS